MIIFGFGNGPIRITYFWHYGISIVSLDIAERHLRTLILVDLQIWVIDVGDFIDRDCVSSATGNKLPTALDQPLS